VARYGADSVVTRAYVPPSELAFAVARVAGPAGAAARAAAAPADAPDAAVAAFAEADLRAAAVPAAVTTSEPPAAEWGRLGLRGGCGWRAWARVLASPLPFLLASPVPSRPHRPAAAPRA
jgi:hypothetical protein